MHEPSVLVWDLLFLLLVIAFAPFIAERLRLPGIIGLLLGGFLIGGTGLGVLRGANVEALGEIGLLYLMFLAGLELDLNVFARYRRSAITFGLLTFALPLVIGTAAALWLEFDPPAALLIGSLWASHTLVMYPVVRRFGLTADPAVATTVGATVITDTLALLVLAIVAGGQSETEGGMLGNLLLLAGLAVLIGYCFVILALVTRWFFAGVGQERTLRFIFVIAGMLSGALVAELAGIEGIVGAFFAGLALNRLVPNGSPLMDRVEFFGNSLFIPAFLVSVGLLIDPRVLVEPRTWVLAAVFLVSLVLGKGLAAIAIGRISRFTRAQVQLVFSLSFSQAAATLAATTVGADVGLFGDDVVNAVVVVIVVSLFASSLIASRWAAQVTPPEREVGALGASVVVAVEDAETARRVAALAQGIASADGGLVVPVHVVVDAATSSDSLAAAKRMSAAIDEQVRAAGIEADPSFRVAQSVRQGVRNTLAERSASLLMLARHGGLRPQDLLFGDVSDEIVASSPVPVLIAELDATTIRRVLVPVRSQDESPERLADLKLTLAIAARLERSGLEMVVALHDPDRLPGGVGLPEDASVERLDGGRLRWVRATARPGDLVLLPAGLGRTVFGLDAARIAAMPEIGVGAVAGPYRSGAYVTAPLATGSFVGSTSG